MCDNVVFICDECLANLDHGANSPDMKRKKNGESMVQATLSNDLTVQHPPQRQSASVSSKTEIKTKTDDKLLSLLKSFGKKLDSQSQLLDRQAALLADQSNKMDQLGVAVCDVGNAATATQKCVMERRSMQHERFPKTTLTNEMEKQPPNGEFGGNRRTYTTVVKSNLPVTPRPSTPTQTPSLRKREKTISLINNATGETVQTAKFPTPKQGKKEIQIGRPLPERQRTQRNADPMSKAIWVSKFHPETKSDEIADYIVAQTEAKDKTKFKCTMLVKKDADLSNISFVSYKIDATPDVYDILIDPENWPSDKHVREFVKLSPPKRKLNDFMTETPKPNATNETDMQIAADPGISGSGNESSSAASQAKN